MHDLGAKAGSDRAGLWCVLAEISLLVVYTSEKEDVFDKQ